MIETEKLIIYEDKNQTAPFVVKLRALYFLMLMQITLSVLFVILLNYTSNLDSIITHNIILYISIATFVAS